MDPISAVASIITLVGLAKEISVFAKDITCGWQSAPEELTRLAEQTDLISKQLQCFQIDAGQSEIDDLLDSSDILTLDQALKAAKSSISAVYQNCGKLGQHSQRRLRWRIYEKKCAEEYLKYLQKTETSLSVVLQLVSLKTGSRAYLRTSQQLLKTQSTLECLVNNQLQTRSTITSKRPATPANSKCPQFLKTYRPSELWKLILACEIAILMTTDGSYKRYDVSALISLPTLLGRLAFMLCVSFQRPLSTWNNTIILGGRLRAVNHVPKESEIIIACKKGDLVAVQDLFRRGEASPNDMSERSKSLLWHATQSGSLALVQYLIQEGTPVTSNILLAAAYWRHPQIARLGFRHGAEPEVIGANGHTLAISLFGSSRKAEPQTEFIDILACNGFENFDAQDACGWTALHKAAAFGTVEDVQALLRFKASPEIRTYNLDWTPLFCAVCFGNLKALHELWPHYEHPSQAKDLRDWNLLHVAAGAGRFYVIPFLLEMGVDPRSVSHSTSRFVPPSLVGLQVTPSDVAKSCGEEAYNKWESVLNAAGLQPEEFSMDIDWSLEKLNGRHGGCECCTKWGF